MKYIIKKSFFKITTLIFAVSLAACSAPNEDQHESYSGITALTNSGGTTMTAEQASQALSKYCSEQNFGQYFASIGGQFSFNAGYKANPIAGYDASIAQKVGADGQQGYYLTNGKSYSPVDPTTGYGIGMDPPVSRIDTLVLGTCRVIMGSLKRASSGQAAAATTGKDGCSYPNVQVLENGNVQGKSARGTINRQGCYIVKMKNDQLRNSSEITLCQDAMTLNYYGGGNVPAESSWILQRGAAPASTATASTN